MQPREGRKASSDAFRSPGEIIKPRAGGALLSLEGLSSLQIRKRLPSAFPNNLRDVSILCICIAEAKKFIHRATDARDHFFPIRALFCIRREMNELEFF